MAATRYLLQRFTACIGSNIFSMDSRDGRTTRPSGKVSFPALTTDLVNSKVINPLAFLSADEAAKCS